MDRARDPTICPLIRPTCSPTTRSPSSGTWGSTLASTTSAVTRSAAGSWCACSREAPSPVAPSWPGRGSRRSPARQGGGANRRALTALADGIALPPDSADAQIAHWAAELGADPRALLCVLGSLVPTPEDDLRRITTPTLVVIGDRDERSDADELAALLPAGRFARVPGDHGGAFAAPELGAMIKAFLAGPADQPGTPPPPAHS